MKLCYDIETDGLDATKIHCLVAKNLETGTIYKFADESIRYANIIDGVRLLENAELLIGHNIIGFDNVQIDKLYGTKLNSKRCHDTWIMSMTLRYKRTHKHGLKGWGEHINNSKIDFDNWEEYSKEMMRYCVQDVELNAKVYDKLLEEFRLISERNPLIAKGLSIELDTAKFNARCRTDGWNFDIDKAKQSVMNMTIRMNEIEYEIEPQLGTRKVFIDKEPKTPKFKKNGEYTTTTIRMLREYFDKEVMAWDTHMMPPGHTFQRYKIEDVTLGSMDLVKDWLITKGWVPDEYQKKKVGFQWVTTGPKLTSTSLHKMGKIGEMIDDYYTLRNRRSVLSTWLECLRDNRLHGNMWTIGTPTFRARHEVIVNLPAVSAAWGKELREVFKADEGEVLVGADSSGNQLRGLCHYVNNADFTKEVIYGDQHQRNADVLRTDRNKAKTFLYAYLFGAGDAKLGQSLTGKLNAAKGRQARSDFAKSIKGLDELKRKLSYTWNNTNHSTGEGYFPAVDGRPVFCPAEHQTLNYLLQSMEGISCKAALSYAMNEVDRQGLRAKPRLFYHDELAFTSHPDDADKVGKILQDAFTEGPKWFNINCMNGGDYMKGKSYADIH